MFRIFTLLLVMMLCTNYLFAQGFASGYYTNYTWGSVQNNWLLKDKIYEEYDENGNLLISRKLTNLGDTYLEYIYTYDSSNKKTSKTQVQ